MKTHDLIFTPSKFSGVVNCLEVLSFSHIATNPVHIH